MYLGAFGAAVGSSLQFFAASYLLVTESWPYDARIQNGSSFDFIIVGGGTAGCTLAARLSEVPDFSVLLVEAGGDPPKESIVPPFLHTLKASRYDWNLTSVNNSYTSQALDGGVERQPRGKMLGGSGSMNDMIYARGFPADYNEWASIIGETWNWTNVLNYFVKTEAMTDENIINNPELMKYHGRNGAIEVAGYKETTLSMAKFIEAFEELGFDRVDDMTNPYKIGVARFSHTINNGQRHSTLTALLDKSRRPNLYILKNAFVSKILIEDNTAFGIKLIKNKKELTFFTNKEVIVSAGTFNTPKLLLLSGVGPKKHLDSLGIEVVKDLPVGDNLHDHVMILNYIAVDNGTCIHDEAAEAMDVIKYLYNRSGSLARYESMAAYLPLSNEIPNVPEYGFYPSCIPQHSSFYQGCLTIGFNSDICAYLNDINQDYELLSIATLLLNPKSRGKVRLRSTNPEENPLIYSGTFENVEDIEPIPRLIKTVWSLANTKYFKSKNAQVVDLEVPGCEHLKGDELIQCKSMAVVTSAWHSVGTAAMGSVVDSDLKVYGLEGLRVADASVMPKVVRGNTNAPIVMIAEVVSDLIKEHYRRPKQKC